MQRRLTIFIHEKMVDILHHVTVMLKWGLEASGCEVDVSSDVNSLQSSRAILLGANFLTNDQSETLSKRLSSDSIVLNVENTNSRFMTADYLALMRRFHVWDYSWSNGMSLSRVLGREVHHFKMFFAQQMDWMGDGAECELDVLFFGSFNERRSYILEQLSLRGLRVKGAFGVYGSQLRGLIERSKVILNVHYYENGPLEMVRLSDLLANGCAVVTEVSADDSEERDIIEGMVSVKYESLVEAVVDLAQDDEKRKAYAKKGKEAFRRRKGEETLSDLLSVCDRASAPLHAVVGSGKSFDAGKLNVDVNARWHPDVVADISDVGLIGLRVQTERFGAIVLREGMFDTIGASHVLEHIPNLVGAMTNLLRLLCDGGELHIAVPYDLSYGAWQDPTHVHAFNERSWLYYCEWHWYLSWEEARFDTLDVQFAYSALGDKLARDGVAKEDILRSPRAVDEMRVVLRKRRLSDQERAHGAHMRGEDRARHLN